MAPRSGPCAGAALTTTTCKLWLWTARGPSNCWHPSCHGNACAALTGGGPCTTSLALRQLRQLHLRGQTLSASASSANSGCSPAKIRPPSQSKPIASPEGWPIFGGSTARRPSCPPAHTPETIHFIGSATGCVLCGDAKKRAHQMVRVVWRRILHHGGYWTVCPASEAGIVRRLLGGIRGYGEQTGRSRLPDKVAGY